MVRQPKTKCCMDTSPLAGVGGVQPCPFYPQQRQMTPQPRPSRVSPPANPSEDPDLMARNRDPLTRNSQEHPRRADKDRSTRSSFSTVAANSNPNGRIRVNSISKNEFEYVVADAPQPLPGPSRLSTRRPTPMPSRNSLSLISAERTPSRQRQLDEAPTVILDNGEISLFIPKSKEENSESQSKSCLCASDKTEKLEKAPEAAIKVTFEASEDPDEPGHSVSISQTPDATKIIVSPKQTPGASAGVFGNSAGSEEYHALDDEQPPSGFFNDSLLNSSGPSCLCVDASNQHNYTPPVSNPKMLRQLADGWPTLPNAAQPRNLPDPLRSKPMNNEEEGVDIEFPDPPPPQPGPSRLATSRSSVPSQNTTYVPTFTKKRLEKAPLFIMEERDVSVVVPKSKEESAIPERPNDDCECGLDEPEEEAPEPDILVTFEASDDPENPGATVSISQTPAATQITVSTPMNQATLRGVLGNSAGSEEYHALDDEQPPSGFFDDSLLNSSKTSSFRGGASNPKNPTRRASGLPNRPPTPRMSAVNPSQVQAAPRIPPARRASGLSQETRTLPPDGPPARRASGLSQQTRTLPPDGPPARRASGLSQQTRTLPPNVPPTPPAKGLMTPLQPRRAGDPNEPGPTATDCIPARIFIPLIREDAQNSDCCCKPKGGSPAAQTQGASSIGFFLPLQDPKKSCTCSNKSPGVYISQPPDSVPNNPGQSGEGGAAEDVLQVLTRWTLPSLADQGVSSVVFTPTVDGLWVESSQDSGAHVLTVPAFLRTPTSNSRGVSGQNNQ